MIFWILSALGLICSIVIGVFYGITPAFISFFSFSCISLVISIWISVLYAERNYCTIPIKTYPLVRDDEFSITYLDEDNTFVLVPKTHALIRYQKIEGGNERVTVCRSCARSIWLLDLVTHETEYIVHKR